MFLTKSGTFIKVEKRKQVENAVIPCMIQHGLAANREALQIIDSTSPVSDYQDQRLTLHGPFHSRDLGMAWFLLSWTGRPRTPTCP